MRNWMWNVVAALLLSMPFNATVQAETGASVESCSLTCDAGPSVDQASPPASVTFLSTADAPGCTGSLAYQWQVLDENNQVVASSKDPVFTQRFSQDGKFGWTFSVTADTQSCTKSGNINIGNPYSEKIDEANMYGMPVRGTPPLDVQFYASDGGKSLCCDVLGDCYDNAYTWKFDDGSMTYEQNPQKNFSTPGLKHWQGAILVDDCFGGGSFCWCNHLHVQGSILVENNCQRIGNLSLCADRKTKDPDSETYTFSGNVNLDGKLLFTEDVVFKAPSAGASKGVLTTSGSISVKLKNSTEKLLTGTEMGFDLDGTAGTLLPKLSKNTQWDASLAGIPLWISGKPITLGDDGVKIEPTLYIGTASLKLAQYTAGILYVPDGDKQLLGMGVVYGELTPGLRFGKIDASYDPKKDVLTAAIEVSFPFLFLVSTEKAPSPKIALRFKPSCSWKINGGKVSGVPYPIPFGTTGLVAKSWGVDIDNICNLDKFKVIVQFNAGIATIPTEILQLSEVGAGLELPNRLIYKAGTLKLLGYDVGNLGGYAKFTTRTLGGGITYQESDLRFTGWIDFAGLFQSNLNGMLSISKKMIVGSASGSLQIPDFSCSWTNAPCRTLKTAVSSVVDLPILINAAEMDMNIRSGTNGWQGLFRGMQTIGPLSLAVQLQYADEAFDLLVGPNYADVIALGVGKAAAAPLAGARRSVTLTAPQSQALFGVAAKLESAAVPAIYLKNPQGATITPANVGQYPGVHYALDKTLKVALFRLDKAAVGTWTLGVTNLTAKQADFQMLAPAAMPTTTFTSVKATATKVDLKAAVRPASKNTKVSFFVSEEASGGVGQPIVENLSAASGVVSATWDTQGLAGGTHYLFARTDDGRNSPVVTYYADPVQTGTLTLKPPTNLSGTCATGLCTLKWTASSSPEAKGYRVLYTDQPALPGYPFTRTAPAGTALQIDGLQSGGAYRFTVVAYDDAGKDSAPAAPWYAGAVPPVGVRQLQSGTPVSDSVAQGAWKFFRISVPSEPKSLEVYTANASSADVDLYLKKGAKPNASTFDYRVDGNTAITVTPKSTPLPLTAGEWYLGVKGKRRATFAVGAQTTSSSRCALTCAATVPAFAKPGAKVTFKGRVTPQNCIQPVRYAWTFGDTTPVTNGQTVSHAYAERGDYTWTLTGTSGSVGCVASGLMVVGNKPPAKLPGAPIIGQATAGNAQATVTFKPPASDGGSPITGYLATSTPGDKTARGPASPLTVTGLTNGTTYTLNVRAINAVGMGPASAASNSVTPSAPNDEYGWRAEPDLPTGADWAGSAVAGDRLYVIGGGDPDHWNKIRIYNAPDQTWSQKSVADMGYLLRAVTVADKVYIFDTSDTGAPGWIYDPASGRLLPLGKTPPNLEWTSEPALYKGKVYFFGGYGPQKTVWAFDPATLAFTKKADMPTAGYGASTAVLNNRIYVIGGNYRYNRIEIYDPAADTWAPSLAFADLMLWGWDTAAPVDGKIAIVEAGDAGRTFLFDPATQKIKAQTAMPRIHGDYLTGEVVAGRLYVAGGESKPSWLDSFLPPSPLASENGLLDRDSPEVTESSERPLSATEAEILEADTDYAAVEAEHLRRIEQIRLEAATQ